VSTVKAKPLPTHRLVLDYVDWRTYGKFLRLLSDRPAVHLTYDRGTLEIMTLSHHHESYGYILARFIDALTEELSLPVKGGRSTTFRRRKRKRGLEPDSCWWITNEALVRGKREIDLRIDPPPDLALEVDITHSSLDRLEIYAALGVPEVWRWEKDSLVCHLLDDKGEYSVSSMSRVISGFPPKEMAMFYLQRANMEENALIREFRSWVQQQAIAGRFVQKQ
jgi:Uma2 family endonuclease